MFVIQHNQISKANYAKNKLQFLMPAPFLHIEKITVIFLPVDFCLIPFQWLQQSVVLSHQGDMPCDYAGHGKTGTFLASRCYRSLKHRGLNYHEVIVLANCTAVDS